MCYLLKLMMISAAGGGGANGGCRADPSIQCPDRRVNPTADGADDAGHPIAPMADDGVDDAGKGSHGPTPDTPSSFAGSPSLPRRLTVFAPCLIDILPASQELLARHAALIPPPRVHEIRENAEQSVDLRLLQLAIYGNRLRCAVGCADGNLGSIVWIMMLGGRSMVTFGGLGIPRATREA